MQTKSESSTITLAAYKQPGGDKGGLKKYTRTEEVPKWLCGQALQTLLQALTDLPIRFPQRRFLLAKAHVTDAFRNVRVPPHRAQNFCYIVDDVLVLDFRLTFGWAASCGYSGLMTSAAEHANCNATEESAFILPEGKAMTSYVKIVDPWENGNPTQISPEVKVNALRKGGPNEPFFSVYADDFIMASVKVDLSDQTALVVSDSLASNHLRLFEPGEKRGVPMLAPNKKTDWNSILGLTIDTYTMRILITKSTVDAIRSTLEQEWPSSKQCARAQDVLSNAEKLWNLTYVVRAARHFVWQLLCLTAAQNVKSKKRTQKAVKLGWEFHDNIAFWKRQIDQQLVGDGQSLGATFFTHI